MMNNRNFWDLGYLWAMSCEIRAIKFMPIVKSLLFSKILCLPDSQFSILNSQLLFRAQILDPDISEFQRITMPKKANMAAVA
jgi:hypothetical protein